MKNDWREELENNRRFHQVIPIDGVQHKQFMLSNGCVRNFH